MFFLLFNYLPTDSAIEPEKLSLSMDSLSVLLREDQANLQNALLNCMTSNNP